MNKQHMNSYKQLPRMNTCKFSFKTIEKASVAKMQKKVFKTKKEIVEEESLK